MNISAFSLTVNGKNLQIPLGADKMRHCKAEDHLKETLCKRQFFQHYNFNILILYSTTLGSDHCSHSLWYQGVKAREEGRGEGTPVELVIFAYIMFFSL